MTLIDEKMGKSRMRWFSHVQRRTINVPVRKIELIQVVGMKKKGRGKPKITLIVVQNDIN